MKSIKQELGLGEVSPESQAVQMRGVMVRSVVLYEEREDFGGLGGNGSGSDGEERVRIEEVQTKMREEEVGVDFKGGKGKDEEEEEVVRRWVDGLL